jgi:hypothetical protein
MPRSCFSHLTIQSMHSDKAQVEALTVEDIADAHEFKDSKGYVADTEGASRSNLKTGRDGHTILISQPSYSPLDILNWSQTRKHIVLIIVTIPSSAPIIVILFR